MYNNSNIKSKLLHFNYRLNFNKKMKIVKCVDKNLPKSVRIEEEILLLTENVSI